MEAGLCTLCPPALPPPPGPHWGWGGGPGGLWSTRGSAVSSLPSPVGCAREAPLGPRPCPACKQLAERGLGTAPPKGVPRLPMRAERAGKRCLPPLPGCTPAPREWVVGAKPRVYSESFLTGHLMGGLGRRG